MQAELESDKEVIENQGQEISTLKSSISELETTILLKENELDFVKQQIESQSKKLSAISDSTILKAKELQANIQKSKEALGNLQSIQAELNESKAILESQKLINAVTIIVLIIIAILGAIAYKNYRTQKSQANIIREQMIMAENQRDEIQNQHLQLEEKSREITDSINYAKKIQEAILPPMRLVEKHLPDSFIFYLPKDIVAGDFYWMEQVSDQVIFAAADCTGHGVPGALVSVVCSNALNRAVREFQLTQPAEILDKTLEIVIERFARSEEEVKDGMDIALCSYNPKNMQLEYAGAHNPLWIIREGATEIEEIKGNKQPIGTYAEHTPFTNHNVQLNKGDSVYLFSDGYIDQFGGEKGKKLKSVNFKKILLSIQDKTIDQQHGQLQKSFAEWKEGIEQLDDVCVIGFRA
jgi:serine phosphatase RsbU (regulator of sigma subunit)